MSYNNNRSKYGGESTSNDRNRDDRYSGNDRSGGNRDRRDSPPRRDNSPRYDDRDRYGGNRDNNSRYDDRGGDDRYGNRDSKDTRARGNDRSGGNDDRHRYSGGNDDRNRSGGGNDDRNRYSGGNDDRNRYGGGNDDRNRYGGGGGGGGGNGRGGDFRGGGNDDRGVYGGGGRGGDFRGGGGGRGGDFRGGGGGRGGGGRGKNSHMGDSQEIKRLLSAPEMTDASIYKSLFPQNLSPQDRLEHVKDIVNVYLPKLATSDWRYSAQTGSDIPLNRDGNMPNVIANHFKLHPTALPSIIMQYNVSIYVYPRGSETLEENSEDISVTEDRELLSMIVGKVCSIYPNVAFAYDGRKTLFVPGRLDFLAANEYVCDIDLFGKRYSVNITYGTEINPLAKDWTKLDNELIRVLDLGLTSCVRGMVEPKQKTWFLHGTKMYKIDPQNMYELDRAVVAMRGYNTSFRCCRAGTVLVMDISVSAFLRGGSLTEIMSLIGRYRSVDEMYDNLRKNEERNFLDEVMSQMKGAKIRLTHIGHSKKFKGFGPKCSAYRFQYTDKDDATSEVTIAQYFEAKYEIKLKYPDFPAVNIGSPKKPVYVPLELVDVNPGQCRQKDSQNVKLVAQLIKYAAIRPNDRANLLKDAFKDGGIISMIEADKNSNSFGLTKESLETKPMEIRSHLLPPAKIQYGNRVLDPELNGSWDLKGNYTFYRPGVSRSGNAADGIKIQIVACGRGIYEDKVREFVNKLTVDASKLGLKLDVSRERFLTVEDNRRADDIDKKFASMVSNKVDMVFCILNNDFNGWYRIVKQYADSRNLPSQCFKYPNIDRSKAGYNENVLLKVNTKLGGVNHTLASRMSSDLGKRGRDDENGKKEPDSIFQDPPNSISWLFNEPCMVLGIDVNHPEPGSQQPSVASLVGSMDGHLSEYAADVSTQDANCETFSYLADATTSLVNTFYRKNGFYPKRIIVFRDGVSESQFDALGGEVNAIKAGLENCGFGIGLNNGKTCPIAMIVCQKRHNTRLFYRDANGTYINPCPGVCSDARGGEDSISSAEYNEFYLNSHVSIQGTSKPCKYTLTYDEIGLQLTEIETLAYWSAYLYCRCNKSVSVAAPVFYAHWSAKRARILLASGVSRDKLSSIFRSWSAKKDSNSGKEATSMFYI